MAATALKDRLMNAWDVLPPATTGEQDEDALYASVGRALTQWEQVETELATLFGQFVVPRGDRTAAERAYGTLGAFNARVEMLEEAARVFATNHPTLNWSEDTLKEIRKKYRGFASRRNEIAHGIVLPYRYLCYMFGDPFVEEPGFCLISAEYSTSKRQIDRKPKFIYSKDHIDHYRSGFADLIVDIRSLYVWIFKDLQQQGESNLDTEGHLPEESEGT